MLLTDFFNLISTRKVPVANKLFPVKVFAMVKEIDKNHALLQLDGREILARVDDPVKKGEYLILEQKGYLEGKTYFKVLQRSFQPHMWEEEILISKPLLVHDLVKGQPVPIVVKFYLEQEDEKNRKNNSSHLPHKRKKCDFMVETQNLGLIVLSFEIISSGYSGKILVESKDTKEIIEMKLNELNNILAAAGKELGLHIEVSDCDLMSAAVTEGKKKLFEGSFVLDRKV